MYCIQPIPYFGLDVNTFIPIIADSYVDLEFGTGCLKVTPAHDINDYNLGIKHNLETIDIFDENAVLNNNGLHYEGKDRFEVRKEIEIELDSKNLLVKKENYIHNVGRSERTNSVVEPRLSKQWFLKMDDITKPAIKNVLENENIKFFPGKFKSTYKYWLENIKDWNISRQLSWGHQIPVFYYGNNENYIVAIRDNSSSLQGNAGLVTVEKITKITVDLKNKSIQQKFTTSINSENRIINISKIQCS
jgi:valyl-tRNA synthetase